MQLTVLGTSAPFPVPGNACSGYLLRSGGPVASDAAGSALSLPMAGPVAPDARPTSLWIDAGTGTFAELQRHLAPGDLDAIFVSHRHADHTADLLVASYAYRFSTAPALAARGSRRIPVFGPEGLAERLAEYLGPTALAGLESVFEFTELHGWGEARVGDLDLSWGPVSHGVPAFGLTVVERGASAPAAAAATAAAVPAAAAASASATATAAAVPAAAAPASASAAADGAPGAGAAAASGTGGVAAGTPRTAFTYSGDTAPCISLVELAEESATLLCEAGYDVAPSGSGEAASGEYVHCTPEDAGRQATEAGVRMLVLTHIAENLAPAAAVARARTTFAGDIRAAKSGATFTV
ncbi:hypothetical protein B7R54_00315 [Subtercola boreus]|uniref:Metallo-beta-lactamase domain-containing protein n=1 Tax=Subtercola boreus TaxID=120213 RepID=A0A3E0VD42_9MICO|nr:MBL fold metallo-hydrolase [Subtercola boreus]RFA07826.1 hypothetical protein B7R54_00315 [Subtercola boreus]TQL55325.1 ribonuclease BN (tRNA processing enzyme) [Subtercola boreus]